MKNLLRLIALSLPILVGCSSTSTKSPIPPQTTPEQVEAPAPVPTTTEAPPAPVVVPVPNSNKPAYRVTFHAVKGYATEAQIKLIKAGEKKVMDTLTSQCARDFLLKAKLRETNGRSNVEVVDHIMNMQYDVPVKMYYKKWGCKIGCTSAVAYRQPPEKKINLNSSFFTASRGACRWGGTMAHEAQGHALGNYGHSSDWNVNREYTVPYKLNGAYEKYGGSVFSRCCVE